MKSKYQLLHVRMFQERLNFILNTVIAKQMHTSLGNPKEVDDKGFLMDVDVQTIDEDAPSCEDKRRDVDHFFKSPVEKSVNGKVKYCTCKLCPYVTYLSGMFANEIYSQKQLEEPRE